MSSSFSSVGKEESIDTVFPLYMAKLTQICSYSSQFENAIE